MHRYYIVEGDKATAGGVVAEMHQYDALSRQAGVFGWCGGAVAALSFINLRMSQAGNMSIVDGIFMLVCLYGRHAKGG